MPLVIDESVPLFLGVWIAGAAYALLGALTVAELVTMRPRSGGLYPVVQDTLGDFAGFVSGWTDWLATCVSAGAIAIVIGEYAGPLAPGLAGRTRMTASLVMLLVLVIYLALNAAFLRLIPISEITPVPALALSATVAWTCIATNTFDTLLALLAFLFVANYALTFVGFFVSRRRAPLARRPFRVPGYPVVPGLALAGSLAFLVAAVLTDPANSAIAVALVALSWPAYRLATRIALQ